MDRNYLYIAGEKRLGVGNDDALIYKCDKDGNLVWDKTWGDSGDDVATSVVLDSFNIYLVGYTTHSSLDYDTFLVKYDLNGNFIWSKTWGSNLSEMAYSVVVDKTSIYVAGGILDEHKNDEYSFVLKYDKNGTLLWNKTWSDSCATAISVDDTNIYVTGLLRLGKVNSNFNVFIYKYDKNGTELWNKSWDGSQNDRAYSIQMDDTNIYLTGWTNCNGFYSDALILKYDKDGNHIWNKTWGGEKSDFAASIALDDGDMYICGGTENNSSGNTDLFILKGNINGSGSVIEHVLFLLPIGFIIAIFIIIRKKDKINSHRQGF